MFKSLLNFFNPFHGVPGGATKETAALSKGHEKNEKIIDQPPNKDKRLNDTTEPGKEDIITSIPERPTLSVCEIVNEDLVLTDDGHEIPNTESELTDKSEKIDKSNDSSEKRLKRGDNLDQRYLTMKLNRRQEKYQESYQRKKPMIQRVTRWTKAIQGSNT